MEIFFVIINVGWDFYGFLIMFFIMFFIFVGIGYFLFGLSVKEYKSFFSVIGSLINIFIGVNSFDVLVELNFVVVRMFYFMYIFLVIMILFVIFVVILNKIEGDFLSDRVFSGWKIFIVLIGCFFL